MFPTLLIVLLFTMGTGAVPYPTLSPVHLTTHHSGLTILMCVVHDIHQGEMELAWISSGARGNSPAAYNLFQSVDGIQSAMSLISVASSEWMSYSCFVSHRVSDRLTHRHYAGLPKETPEMYHLEMFDDEETSEMCSDHHSSCLQEVRGNRDLMLVQALRVLLLKITIFNVLMTVQVVIKVSTIEDLGKNIGMNWMRFTASGNARPVDVYEKEECWRLDEQSRRLTLCHTCRHRCYNIWGDQCIISSKPHHIPNTTKELHYFSRPKRVQMAHFPCNVPYIVHPNSAAVHKSLTTIEALTVYVRM